MVVSGVLTVCKIAHVPSPGCCSGAFYPLPFALVSFSFRRFTLTCERCKGVTDKMEIANVWRDFKKAVERDDVKYPALSSFSFQSLCLTLSGKHIRCIWGTSFTFHDLRIKSKIICEPGSDLPQFHAHCWAETDDSLMRRAHTAPN